MLGEGSLKRASARFVEHYHAEPPHQGKEEVGPVELTTVSPNPSIPERSISMRVKTAAVSVSCSKRRAARFTKL